MKVEGCEDAKADWENGWAWAKYDPEKTSPEELVKAINENTAFEAKLPEKNEKSSSVFWTVATNFEIVVARDATLAVDCSTVAVWC